MLPKLFYQRRGIWIEVVEATASKSTISTLYIRIVVMTGHISIARAMLFLVRKVTWRARPCTVGYLESQYERMLWRIDSENPLIKIVLSTF